MAWLSCEGSTVKLMGVPGSAVPPAPPPPVFPPLLAEPPEAPPLAPDPAVPPELLPLCPAEPRAPPLPEVPPCPTFELPLEPPESHAELSMAPPRRIVAESLQFMVLPLCEVSGLFSDECLPIATPTRAKVGRWPEGGLGLQALQRADRAAKPVGIGA